MSAVLSTEPSVPGVELRYVQVRGVRLHVAIAGTGPLVLLMHGFPGYWGSWRRQIPVLVRAGYRVVAPDMRGYNLSDSPASTRSYSISELTADMAELISVLGEESATVVAHDWGAAIAWELASAYPHRVARLVTLNIPHPERLIRAFLRPAQLRKSWYVFFFQLPWLPERLLMRRNAGLLRRIFLRDMPADDIDLVARASQRGLAGPIAYYRANMRDLLLGRLPKRKPVRVPVLVLWGEHDRFLCNDLALPSPNWAPDARLVRVPEGSHWVHQDAAERVNRELLAFLGAPNASVQQAAQV